MIYLEFYNLLTCRLDPISYDDRITSEISIVYQLTAKAITLYVMKNEVYVFCTSCKLLTQLGH